MQSKALDHLLEFASIVPFVSGLWVRTRTLTPVQSERAGKPQMHQGLVPRPPTNHYELSIGVILAFSPAYNIVDE